MRSRTPVLVTLAAAAAVAAGLAIPTLTSAAASGRAPSGAGTAALYGGAALVIETTASYSAA